MINEDFVRFLTFFSNLCKFNGLAAGTAALIAGLLATTTLAQEQDIPELVGEVSLVLGKAYIENGVRERHQIEAGSPVRVSDQILTGANGHVHVRFIDQALVSVRPDSKLEIVRYDYNAKNPDRSVVKFNLLEGVTRSISGAAAKSARQRFRLNTPIAAIGVRGTDFVVSASSDMVRALVNEGTIVMAPYSDQCSADTFGPCVSNAIELTGDSLQVLELIANTPAVSPTVLARNPALFREELQLAAAGSSDDDQNGDAENKSEGSEVYLEGVTSVRVAADARQIALTERADTDSVVDFTPPAPIAEQQVADRQLLWGRWSWVEAMGDLERITLTAELAEAGRDITIGNGWYGLFRDQQGGTARVQSGLGVVGFSLSSAQAFYSSESGIVAMQVTDGALNIDFERRTFSTELNLQHASTGLIDINAMGRIYSGGYFYDRSDTQNVVGAVSLDGQEAGYFFDKQLESGGIQGLTLWDSQ